MRNNTILYITLGFAPTLMEMEMEIELPEGSISDFGIAVSNQQGEEYLVGFDAANNEFYSDRTKSGKIDFSSF